METWVVSVCVSEEDHTLLAAASELTGTSVSEFIRRKALEAAEAAILERRSVTVARWDWDAFEGWAHQPTEASGGDGAHKPPT
jgi:uncharacterized protein (DUF1778 family)